MEEQELALRCARKDKDAQRELYLQYRSRILALCRRYAEDPADAEDMMQDAFIKIFKVIGYFKWTRPGSLYSWMSRVSINLAFDTSRRRRRLASQLVDVDNIEDDIPEEPAYDETASVPSEVLNGMIESLPEGYRTIFRLYCIDGLSHREIADLLGIKEKSSSASLSRARALLAESVRQYWRDLDDGSSPEDWTNILRKMRREETVRGIKVLLALLIPVASLMLWLQPRQSHESIAPCIAEVIAAESPSVIIHHTIPSPRGLADMRPVVTTPSSPFGIPSEAADALYEKTTDAPNDVPDIPTDTSDIPANVSDVPQEEWFPTFAEEERKSSPRVSLSFRAGSGSGRRNTNVSLESSPYIAALTFMNTLDPSYLPDVRSNSVNFIQWYNPCDTESEHFATNKTNSYKHDLPVTFGLTARMDLTPRFGAECGMEYTYMHSSIETDTERLSQNLHFIGLPVRLDTRIWSWNGFDMYAGIGIKAEKCVAASLGQVKCEEKSLQWSTGTFAGVQYSIGRRSHLYFQPELSYYLTKTDLITYRTENPLTFSLNAGVRFDL